MVTGKRLLAPRYSPVQWPLKSSRGDRFAVYMSYRPRDTSPSRYRGKGPTVAEFSFGSRGC